MNRGLLEDIESMETVQRISEQIFKGRFDKPAADSDKPLLIIDDNPELIAALQTVLKGHYRLLTCLGFEEARPLATKVKVVLLDIKMAVRDGVEVFGLLKRINPDIRIIFHSAYPGDNRHAAVAAGLPHDGYLTKGEYTIPQLLAAIDGAIQK